MNICHSTNQRTITVSVISVFVVYRLLGKVFLLFVSAFLLFRLSTGGKRVGVAGNATHLRHSHA